jgi:hypothetical protein
MNFRQYIHAVKRLPFPDIPDVQIIPEEPPPGCSKVF